VATVALLVATMLVGTEMNGGTRWISLFGQQFQPSEFAKVALILLVATLVIKLRESTNIAPSIITLAVVIGLPVLLVLMQPDLGTTLIIFAGIIAVAWFGELSMKPLAIAGLLVVFIAASAVMLVGFRMDRIDAWLDPFAYASTTGYQIINSFYAFAGGGISGVGLGMSHQKYLYLPEPYNDLIFPIIGEEFGLIGAVTVVLLFLVFMFASYRIARNAPDIYGRMIAGSAATLIGFQAFLNMLCMVNLFPMTGKPLPFFSAGGTSIIVTLILTGLILNVSLRSKAVDEAKERREELLILDGGRQLGLAGGLVPALSTKKASAKPASASSARSSGKLSSASAKRSNSTESRAKSASGKTASGKAASGKAVSGKTASGKTMNSRSGRSTTTGNKRQDGKTASGKTPARTQPTKQSDRAQTNPALKLSPARTANTMRNLSPARTMNRMASHPERGKRSL
jgi:cell division protein FtsW